MDIIRKFFSVGTDRNGDVSSWSYVKKLYKAYWQVAWPASLEGIFLNLILLADLVMVGELGISAAAAVGIVSQPKMIMQLFGKSLGTGVTAVVARRRGENNLFGLNSCIKQSLLITILLYVVLVYFAIAYRENILLLMGANSEYFDLAVIYFTYLTVALFFKSLSSVLSAVQVGVGNTSVILWASVIGNIINVVFNYVLIFGHLGFPRLRIQGAAIATIIGEFIIFSVLLISILFQDKDGIDIRNNGSIIFSKKVIWPVLEIGANSFFEQIFERVGLFIFARLIAELGTVAVGTHHYCIILWDLYYYFGLGMGTACASFAGRKLGEKRPELAKIYMKIAQKSGIIISSIVSIIFLTMGTFLFKMMVVDDNVVNLGANIMMIVAVLIIPQTQAQILTGVLRGAGDNRFIAKYSLFVSAIFRSILAYVFAFIMDFGLYGIWYALLVDEVLKMIFSKYRITKGIWITKNV